MIIIVERSRASIEQLKQCLETGFCRPTQHLDLIMIVDITRSRVRQSNVTYTSTGCFCLLPILAYFNNRLVFVWRDGTSQINFRFDIPHTTPRPAHLLTPRVSLRWLPGCFIDNSYIRLLFYDYTVEKFKTWFMRLCDAMYEVINGAVHISDITCPCLAYRFNKIMSAVL